MAPMAADAAIGDLRPAGFHDFHRKRFLNYQLNRLHATGFLDAQEIRSAAAQITTIPEYVAVFDALSLRLADAGRPAAAASASRAAELFTPHTSAAKQVRYRRFIDLFDAAFADGAVTKHDVPYANGLLPTRRISPPNTGARTVLFFAGFDSIVEEFFVIWRHLADAGFDVIAFDGPGQGGARTMHGLVTEHDWEKPVGTICDHFELDDVTVIGLSMGGYWAIRAAAHESRISRAVSWSPVYDWLERVPAPVRPPLRSMLRARRYMNWNIRLRTRFSPTLAHIVSQAVYNAGGSEPFDAVRWLLSMNAEHVSSQLVRQPVLLLGGEHDAFQPAKLLHRQADALTSADVTTRVFTVAEGADQHCQMGNLPLALRVLIEWLGAPHERRCVSDRRDRR